MAWLSFGTSNDDLCDKMKANGVLEEGPILEAFRSVDRGDFVPSDDRLQAYHDRPFKRGCIHMSAPHMYVTVLEALDLKPGNAFLNVGSGSGYLCCLAWCLLGEHGLTHGIEISPKAVELSRESIEKFSEKRRTAMLTTISNHHNKTEREAEPVTIVQGNCFNIDVHNSAVQCKYDRIYVGAGCPEARKQFFYDLLADGGILVLPVNESNQMLKVTKITGNIFSVKHVSNVHFAPLIEVDEEDDEATPHNSSLPSAVPIPLSHMENQLLQAQIDSLFIFQRSSSSSVVSANASMTSNKVQLPSLIWAPVRSRHRQFPFEFREIVKLILLASNQCDYSRPNRSSPKCLCSVLPTPIWYIILSYASRDWFVPQKSELDVLRWELMTERRLRREAEDKLTIAEQARRIAERERDLFRSVMMRMDPRANKPHFISASSAGAGNDHSYHLDLDDEEDEEDEEDELSDSDDEEGEEDDHMFVIMEDHDDDDDEEEEEEEEEEENGNEDQHFLDAIDLSPDVAEPTTASLPFPPTATAAAGAQIYLMSEESNSSNQFSVACTSFGSNTTREAEEVDEKDEEMDFGDHDHLKDDRDSFNSASSSTSSSDDSIALLDAEEHFISDD